MPSEPEPLRFYVPVIPEAVVHHFASSCQVDLPEFWVELMNHYDYTNKVSLTVINGWYGEMGDKRPQILTTLHLGVEYLEHYAHTGEMRAYINQEWLAHQEGSRLRAFMEDAALVAAALRKITPEGFLPVPGSREQRMGRSKMEFFLHILFRKV